MRVYPHVALKIHNRGPFTSQILLWRGKEGFLMFLALLFGPRIDKLSKANHCSATPYSLSS